MHKCKATQNMIYLQNEYKRSLLVQFPRSRYCTYETIYLKLL